MRKKPKLKFPSLRSSITSQACNEVDGACYVSFYWLIKWWKNSNRATQREILDNKLTRYKLSQDQIHPTTLRKRDSNPIMWCKRLLNFTIIYMKVNTENNLSKSKSVRSFIQNIVTFCQILGVRTFILSITTCSSLSCLANGIANLAVDVYASSDCSAIPMFIFENRSQA